MKKKSSELGKILLPAFRKATRDLKASETLADLKKKGYRIIRRKIFRWEFKDSHRCYWAFSAFNRMQTAPDASGFFETEWEITVRCEGNLIYDNIMSIQYAEDITLHDILVAYSTYVVSMVAGAARYAHVPLSDKKKP